jgi:hypothetical protein
MAGLHALHPALKRGLDVDLGLDLDALQPAVVDLVGDTRDPCPAGGVDAKRRRVEAIARGCLRGRRPVLITSALKGPFDSSWTNPWARHPNTASHVASPETSRAAELELELGIDLDSHHGDKALHDRPQLTAPIADDDGGDDGDDGEPTTAIKSFPSDTHEYISNRTPLCNPFWLRRPPPSTTRPASANTHNSPLRSRAGPLHHGTRTHLQLAPTAAPLGRPTLPTETSSGDDVRSSASASMLISTPPDSSRDRADSAQEEDSATLRSSQALQHAQPAPPPQTPSITPSGLGTTASPSSQSFSRRQQPTQSTHIIVPATTYKASTISVQVARSASASSAGFVYRRVGGSKARKPRAVSFSSPEAVVTKAIKAESVHRTAEEAAEADSSDDCGQQESCQSNRNSAYSTQAAMLLAQLEFQQDSSPSKSPETLRPWSQPTSNTPRTALPEASPAITPLSVFNTSLKNACLDDSVLRGAPLSTQDLFTAASPFAFSTIEKKRANPLQNSLRSALAVGRTQGTSAEKTTAPSPTPSAERLPLKDKNAPSLASLACGKTSQTSQLSQTRLVESPSRGVLGGLELPELDLHTSLDDFGPEGDVHFTDRFLAGLGET